MIKISYPRLVQIARTMGFGDDTKDDYDTLLNILKEHNITVTTQAIPPGYILTFTSDHHETVFKLTYSEILDKIKYEYKSDIIVVEQD